jgi:hypothetical protein
MNWIMKHMMKISQVQKIDYGLFSCIAWSELEYGFKYSILIFSVGSYDAIFLGGDGPIKEAHNPKQKSLWLQPHNLYIALLW